MYFSIEKSRKVYLLQNWAEKSIVTYVILVQKAILKHPIGKTTSGFLLPLCPVLCITTEVRSKFISRSTLNQRRKEIFPFLPLPTPQGPTKPPKYSPVWDFLQWYWNIWLVWLETRKPLNFLSYLRTMSSLKKKIICGHLHTKEFILFCFLSKSVSGGEIK